MRQQFFSPIRYFIVRSVKRLIGELTVSTLATLIVTASLSNLFFASRTAPTAVAHFNADAVIFSPQPIGPGNNGLESLGIEATVAGRDKVARDQNSSRKIPHLPIRTVELAAPAPATPPLQPPLQLSGATIAATSPIAEPGATTSADAPLVQSERFRPVSFIFRPIHAIAGQLTWLLPKL
jgi:hypothetical protein